METENGHGRKNSRFTFACTDVKLYVSTSSQLTSTSAMSSVSVAGVDLPVSDEMKVLGVFLDRRLSFDRHATSVARACNFHAQAIRPSDTSAVF